MRENVIRLSCGRPIVSSIAKLLYVDVQTRGAVSLIGLDHWVIFMYGLEMLGRLKLAVLIAYATLQFTIGGREGCMGYFFCSLIKYEPPFGKNLERG